MDAGAMSASVRLGPGHLPAGMTSKPAGYVGCAGRRGRAGWGVNAERGNGAFGARWVLREVNSRLLARSRWVLTRGWGFRPLGKNPR